jgi:hypothetical protein
MIRFRWKADHYFSGSIEGEIGAACRASALEAARADMAKHPRNYGGNVDTTTLRLTHQKRPNNKKWKEIHAG